MSTSSGDMTSFAFRIRLRDGIGDPDADRV